jgi:hypothetical protein
VKDFKKEAEERAARKFRRDLAQVIIAVVTIMTLLIWGWSCSTVHVTYV